LLLKLGLGIPSAAVGIPFRHSEGRKIYAIVRNGLIPLFCDIDFRENNFPLMK